MGLTINTLKKQEEDMFEKITTGTDLSYYILDRRVYLNKAKDGCCEEGNPAAAFLLGNKGTRIPAEYAKQIGLLKLGSKPEDTAKPEAPKEKEKGKDKSKGKGKDK